MSDRTTAELLAALDAARADLIAAAASVGADSVSGDGLDDLAEKVRKVTVPAGTRRACQVSKAGAITQGDSVTLCWEPDTSGAAVRFAAEDANILTAADNAALGLGGVIFTQGGQTKLKLFSMSTVSGHEVTLSNTEVLADEVLEEAALVLDDRGNVYALYNQDGDGLIAAYTAARTLAAGGGYVESIVLAADWTDIWMDGNDPENLLAEARYLPCGTETLGVKGETYAVFCTALCVFCTRLAEGSVTNREAALLCFQVSESDYRMKELREAALTPAAWECLAGLEYATDAYAQGWAMAVNPYVPTSYITYPKPDETGRGLLTFTLEEALDGDGYPYLVPAPTGYADCLLLGAVPSAAVAVLDPDGDTPGPMALASGITRRNTKTQAIESLLGVELWRATADGGRVAVAAAEESTRYGTNISRLCCRGTYLAGHPSALMAYAFESTMYGLVLETRSGDDEAQAGYTGGPAVALAEFDTYAKALAVRSGLAALVWQKDGAGYIKPFPLQRVAAKADPRRSDGTAMADGLTGETIPVNLTYLGL